MSGVPSDLFGKISILLEKLPCWHIFRAEKVWTMFIYPFFKVWTYEHKSRWGTIEKYLETLTGIEPHIRYDVYQINLINKNSVWPNCGWKIEAYKGMRHVAEHLFLLSMACWQQMFVVLCCQTTTIVCTSRNNVISFTSFTSICFSPK